MTRKHIEAIVAAIRKARQDIIEKEPQESHADMLDGSALTVEHIGDALRRLNPAFDRERFLKAAGVQS